MQAPAILTTVNDRFFRAAALRDARARVTLSAERRAALEQAGLLVAVAQRVAQPVEALPAGARPAVLLGLYREAVYWALVAGRPADAERPDALAAAFDRHPLEALIAAAGPPTPNGPNPLEIIRATLFDASTTSLTVTAEAAAKVGAFTEALVAALDAPGQRMDRIRGQRWARILVSALALVLVCFVARVAMLGPNLAADKPFRTSSSWSGCAADPNCVGLAFHTEPQASPWAELDLGRPTTFHRIEVTNRQDCCAERAVPLIVEVSADDNIWREVAHRDEEFSTWTINLPPLTARYVRFKVPRQTAFHLQRVAIR